MTSRCRFISTHRAAYGVTRLCRVLTVRRQGYYEWLQAADARAERERAKDALAAEITAIHAAHRHSYGRNGTALHDETGDPHNQRTTSASTASTSTTSTGRAAGGHINEWQSQDMSTERVALIVIDMQNGFVNDHSRSIIPRVVDLVERWQTAERPVVFTRYFNYPGSPFEKIINWTKLQGPPQTDIIPELTPYTGRALAILNKEIYSYFTNEGAALAEKEGWTEMVFCGLATESCVLKSAVDAFE